MTHQELSDRLLKNGFTRVERDDRLLDVFPKETREKGVELWQRWKEETIDLVYVRLPYNEKKVARYAIPQAAVEEALNAYALLSFTDFPTQAKGSRAV
jgi:hypothetical protein